MAENETVVAGVRGRAELIERITFVGVILGALSTGLYVVLFFRTGAWQMLADAGCVALAVVCMVPTRRLARRRRFEAAGYWILIAVTLAYGGGTLVWSGATLYNAAGGVLLIFLVATAIRPRKWGVWLLAAVLYVALLWLVDWGEPLPRYEIAQSPILRLHIPLVTGALVLLTLWQVVRVLRMGNIRTRLLIAFVSLTLLPVIILVVGMTAGGLRSVQQGAVSQLESVAILKDGQLRTWVEDLRIDLQVTLSGQQVFSNLSIVAKEPAGSEEYATAYLRLSERLRQVLEQTGRYEELFLVDSAGMVLLSTDAAGVNRSVSNQEYFRQGLQGPYVQRPYYSPTTMRTTLYASQPIVDEGGEALGILAGLVDLGKLNEVMDQTTGLGETGETYLVGSNGTLLTPSRSGEVNVWMSSEGIRAAIDGQGAGSGLYANYRGVPVVGAYRWLPDLQVALLAEQEQAEAFRSTYAMLGIAAGTAVLGLLLAVAAALFVTRSIATPLAGLAETATQIAAGDLTQEARVEREDEVGALARAFNSMTVQLRELIGSLEKRVAERTQELARHSAYLEAAAEVGHAASTILQAEPLIQQVVELIRQQFDLYYVGLFLVETASADAGGQWAVLKAGTGEAGRVMLGRGHRLRVGGESMIGWSIARGQSRVALEVGEDAVHLATPELPLTRSEAALPLNSRGQVLGALTVQSSQPNAFDQDAIVVLQTMADQVAVALDNARLFAERQEALVALQRAYGEMSSQAWRDLVSVGPGLSYRSDETGVARADDIWRPEMGQALREGRPVRGDGDGADGKLPLAVPIKVRGEVVGVLDTYKPADTGGWTSEELALIEEIVEQLDVALESARLHQDAQRRASREETIRRVVEQMQRSREVEAILQATMAELTRALGVPRAYVRLGTEAELSAAREAYQQRASGTDLEGTHNPTGRKRKS